MARGIPAKRIQLDDHAPKPYAALMRLQQSIELDRGIGELVKVRASQINGCVFCLDMHWKDARAAGESEERLYSLDVWWESPLYDERERAALALCEAMTRIADDHIPAPVWDSARAAFSEPELANLVFAITAINAWNRLAITSGAEPGHYDPSMRLAA